MRIPASTIVMGVVTLVPFGLAFRDVAQGKSRMSAEERELAKYAALAAEEEARYAAERAAEEAEERKVLDARARVADLFGAEPATFAGPLAGLAPGMPKAGAEALFAAMDPLTTAADLEVTGAYHGAGEHLTSVMLEINRRDGDEDRCDELARQLRTRWGAATPTPEGEGQVWRHPGTGARLTLTRDYDCELLLEASVSPAQWIAAKAPTATVPVWAIGGRADALRATLPATSEIADEFMTWPAPGLGAGQGTTSVTAMIAGGKVIGVRAIVKTTEDTALALHEHLAATFGPATDGDASVVFKGKPGVEMSYERDSGVVMVLAGSSW